MKANKSQSKTRVNNGAANEERRQQKVAKRGCEMPDKSQGCIRGNKATARDKKADIEI